MAFVFGTAIVGHDQYLVSFCEQFPDIWDRTLIKITLTSWKYSLQEFPKQDIGPAFMNPYNYLELDWSSDFRTLANCPPDWLDGYIHHGTS